MSSSLSRFTDNQTLKYSNMLIAIQWHHVWTHIWIHIKVHWFTLRLSTETSVWEEVQSHSLCTVDSSFMTLDSRGLWLHAEPNQHRPQQQQVLHHPTHRAERQLQLLEPLGTRGKCLVRSVGTSAEKPMQLLSAVQGLSQHFIKTVVRCNNGQWWFLLNKAGKTIVRSS